jgi:hypothetical protein
MTGNTAPRERETPAIALQERVRLLEIRVAALTDAVQILTRGLAGLPTAEPGGRPAAAGRHHRTQPEEPCGHRQATGCWLRSAARAKAIAKR